MIEALSHGIIIFLVLALIKRSQMPGVAPGPVSIFGIGAASVIGPFPLLRPLSASISGRSIVRSEAELGR